MELDSNSTEKVPESGGISHVLLAPPKEAEAPPVNETSGLAGPTRDSTGPSATAGMEDDDSKKAAAAGLSEENTIAPPPAPPPAAQQHPLSSTEEEDSVSGHEQEHSPPHSSQVTHREEHDDDEEGDGEEPLVKKEKRLAMNRASARERRRRKRIHTEELEQRVIQLSRQCVALQKTNEGLQLYVAKLETDLVQANAVVSVLSAKTQDQSARPASLQDPAASLLAQAAAPPSLQTQPARTGAFAETIQEQERVRALLNLLQQQENPLAAAAPPAQSAASRLRSSLLGAAGASQLVAQNEDDRQRKALLELLTKRQAPRDAMDGALSSLVAGRAPPPSSQLDPALLALLGGRAPAATPLAAPPAMMEAALASLLGGNATAPPVRPPTQLPGSDPLASYLSSIQQQQQQPRGGIATRMSDFGSPQPPRINAADLLASINAERGLLPGQGPSKKRRSNGY